MSKEKQFEYIENKIKQAAGNSQPVYDELAWQKMEALLDHKEKKRRFFFWWWLLPLLMVGAWGIYKAVQPTQSQLATQQKINATEKKDLKAAPAHQPKTVIPVDKSAAAATAEELPDSKQTAAVPVSSTGEAQKSVADIQQKKNAAITNNNVAAPIVTHKIRKDVKLTASDDVANHDNLSNGKTVLSKKIKGKTKGKTTATASIIQIDSLPGNEKAIVENEPVDKTAVQQNFPDKKATVAATDQVKKDSVKNIAAQQQKNTKDSIATAPKKTDVKKKESHGSGLYLLAAVGADAASVKFLSFANSTVVPKYGIGVGYQVSKKWAIQTGLYISNKKYAAGPDDYHPKKGSYWYNVKIDEVDAACLVYEIPVTVRYNFIQKNSFSFYGTVAASSYIMKKEDCDYRYTRYNVPYETSWVYTGNKHWFSQFSFSVGIEKQLTPRWSLLAEPSFSLPISGVGDGRVNLYSTALQIGARYFPFYKK